MPKRLTIIQQRGILNALPPARKLAIKRHCMVCQQKGAGLKDILANIGNILGPIAKDIGIKALKDFIFPFLMQMKAQAGQAGRGISLAGSGLKLAGQGPGKPKKGSPAAKAKMARLRAMKKK